MPRPYSRRAAAPHAFLRRRPVLHDVSEEHLSSDIHVPGPGRSPAADRRDQDAMMSELRSMKGLIEERFGALAFMERCSAIRRRRG
jgi:flagellar biosynthesis protein FlhF